MQEGAELKIHNFFACVAFNSICFYGLVAEKASVTFS